jgi:hypothetical protein
MPEWELGNIDSVLQVRVWTLVKSSSFFYNGTPELIVGAQLLLAQAAFFTNQIPELASPPIPGIQ